MTSEHHGGFAGYLPNPLQLAGFLLDAMPPGWAAPCPLLLPLRPAALVAEETAWLAARFPGRVGLGVAAGALAGRLRDHGDVPMDDLTPRFTRALELVAAALRGDAVGSARRRCRGRALPRASDPGVERGRERDRGPSSGARRRRACCSTRSSRPNTLRELVDAYRAAGGTGPCVLVRRAWLGEPPSADVDRQVDVYRDYAPADAPSHWGANEMVVGTSGAEVADQLRDALQTRRMPTR